MGILLLRTGDMTKEKTIADFAQTRGLACIRLLPVQMNDALSKILADSRNAIPHSPTGITDPAMGEKKLSSPPSGHKTPPVFYQLPEMLIFHEVTDAEMDGVLALCRKNGAAPIALKAVVTPHNLSWTLYELAEELSEEHRQMNG